MKRECCALKTFKNGCVVLLLISAGACSKPSPTAPTVALTPVSPPAPFVPGPLTTFHLTGIVADDEGSPVTGATVTIQPFTERALPPSISGTTDARGVYSVDFDAAPGESVASVKAESPGHDPSYNYVRHASAGQDISQNVHLYRIKHVMAGESALLTVVPGDTFCGDNDQFVCRSVHVMAPASGQVLFEAVPTGSDAGTGLEIAGRGLGYSCCVLTAAIPVTAGAEIVANVGMWWTSTASQSFVLKTSPVRP